MTHAQNCNFLGNSERMKEMEKEGLSAEEQSAVFHVHGIPVSPTTIDALNSDRDALMSKPLPRSAVVTAVENHKRIAAEANAEEVEDEDEGVTVFRVDGKSYMQDGDVITEITDEDEE